MNRSIFLILTLFSLSSFAQQTVDTSKSAKTPSTFKPKSTTIKANNSMSQLKQMAKEDNVSADNSFKNQDYTLALALYLDELSKKPEDNDLRVKIGQCYLETDIKKSNAIDYFEYALAHGYKNNDIVLFLGRAYLYAERFDDAITKFEQYKNLENKHIENITKAEKYLKYANTGKQLKAKAINVTLTNMGDFINSTKTDNIPIIDPLESNLYFNTNRNFMQEYGEYTWDVNVSEFKGSKWKKSHSLGSKINTIDNEFLVGTSPNVDNLLIRPETYTSSGNLLYCPLINKKFDTPLPFTASINGEKQIETTGCLSTSGDTLFFASNREGGFGGLDIYYSIKLGNDWGIPQNLGPNINTPENEDYPNIMKDGKTLYFASEGHDGMGGFDIFTSTFNNSSQEWSTPKNIGYPLNTTYDDFNISFAANSRYAYVSQVKDEGVGEYDIYRVVFNNIEAPIITYTGIIAVGDTATAKPLLELSPKNTIRIFDKKTDAVVGEYQLSKDSRYVFALTPGSYYLKIESDVMDSFKKNINIPDRQPDNNVIISDIYIKR